MFHLIRVGETPTLLLFIMVGVGNDFQVSPEYPQDFDSDVLRRAQQRVSGDEVQQRSDVISDWLFPNRKEERQLGQQLALMSEEPSIRMEALKKAGINPLTAAAGIAGASPSSTPQPASSVNPIGDVAGAVGSVASGYDALANGVATLFKLKPEIDEITSRARKNLASAGLDKVNTDAVLTDNKYRDENWEAELNIKRQSYINMKQQLSNMKAQHAEIYRHIDEMMSTIELNGSQKDYFDAMQMKVQEDLRWQKELNDWCLQNKLMIRDSGVDGYIFNMMYNDVPQGDVDAFFDHYYDYCRNRNYFSTKGVRDAEVDTAFDKAFNEALGNVDVQAKYASYFGDIEVLKETLKEMYKELIDNPGNPFNFVGKVLNLLFQGAAALDIPKDVSHNPWIKPDVSPKKSN